jgi:D-alanyl-D-alanine carboxypeptidase
VGAAALLAAGACSSTPTETRPSVTAPATAAPTAPPVVATTPTSPPSPPTTVATTTVPPTTAAPTTAAPTGPPTTTFPVVDAAAYAVYDQRSQTMLSSGNAEAPLAVGSLMKLLMADAVYAAGDPVKVVVAPEGLVQDREESIIGLLPGQQFQRDTLTRAMLVVSANDAARALAVDIAGSEAAMAEIMNARAAALGLANTRAVNVTGLDAEGQYSTATDLIRLSAILMANPTFQAAARQQSASLNNQTLPATNDLLTLYPGADGIKTGRTTQAGWCIVASASRVGRRIIVAVLGAPTEEARNAAATELLDWGFTQP